MSVTIEASSPLSSAEGAAPQLVDFGLRSYQEIWELQHTLHDALVRGDGKEVILIGEHLPVITLGRGADASNILTPAVELKNGGIETVRVERGGDVTYHGPGQIVLYPILNLSLRRRDVGWYMRGLEEVIVRVLDHFEILGERIPGKTGVWVHSPVSGESQKIASLGVRISRWFTYHGVSLNVHRCEEGFRHIHPCGMPGIQVTSLEELRDRMDIQEVKSLTLKYFQEIFDFRSVGQVSFQGTLGSSSVDS